MAKRATVKSDFQIKREEAMAAQKAFDASILQFGGLKGLESEFVQSALYGDRPDSVYAVALAEDVDFVQRRYSYRVESLRRFLESAEAEVVKFANKLTESIANPQGDVSYNFRWADGAMEAAAKVGVLRTYIAVMDAKGPAVVEEYAREQVLRNAGDQSQSTSSASNTMARLTLVAWAAMAQGRFCF